MKKIVKKIMILLFFVILMLSGVQLMKPDKINANEPFSTTSNVTKENKAISPIIIGDFSIRSVQTGAVIDQDNPLKGFDKDNLPGNDMNSTNNIVRANDTVVYNVGLTLLSGDNTEYHDIKVKITGLVQNGVSASGGRLNAVFSKGFNGKFNLTDKTSTMDYVFGNEPTQQLATGSAIELGIPLEIQSAQNGAKLVSKYRIQVLSAKNPKGEEIDLSGQNIVSEEIVDGGVFVSSKVSFETVLEKNTYQTLAFNAITNSTDDNKAQMSGFSLKTKMIPLPGRTNMLGVDYPSSVNIRFSQGLKRKDLLTGVITDLPIPSKSRKIKLFDIGLTSNKFNDVLNSGYPNYTRMVQKVNAPVGKGTSERSVFNSGVVTGSNDDSGRNFIMGFHSPIVTNHFPTHNGSNSGSADYDTLRERYFSSVGSYIVIPTDALLDNTSIMPFLFFESLTYREGSETKTITAEDMQNQNWQNTRITWTIDKIPRGSISTRAKYFDDNKKALGSDPNVNPSGDSVGTKGQKIFVQSKGYYGGTNVTDPMVMQKWNPNESLYDKTRLPETAGLKDPLGGTLPKGTITYGVSKINDYSLKNLRENTEVDYNWYATPKQAEANGIISAVKVQGGPEETSDPVDQFLNVPRIIVADKIGAKDKAGNPYATLIHATAKRALDGSLLVSGKFNWEPTEYENGGIKSYQAPLITVGDTLNIVPYTVRVSKASNRQSFVGTDKVLWSLNPILSSSSSSGLKVDVKITDTLPRGLLYETGSAKLGEEKREPIVTENSDGTTTLIWELSDREINKAIPKITYSTMFNTTLLDFGSGSVSLLNRVTISSPGDTSDVKIRTHDATVTVTNVKYTNIRKTVDKTVLEASGEKEKITYSLQTINASGNDMNNFVGLDVLPQSGEEGSSFNGTYKLVGINSETPNTEFWYTNNVINRNTDPNSIITSGSGWIKYTGGALSANAKAVYYKIPVLKDNTTSVVKVSLELSGNKAGDKLLNKVTANSTMNSKLESTYTETKIANRIVEGIVWYDDNHNGQKDDSEGLVKDTTVYLYEVLTGNKLKLIEKSLDGTLFVDAAKKSIIKTDSSGKYRFNGLSAGEYVVGFGIKDKITSKELFITKAFEKDVPDELNSKVSLTEVENNTVLTPVGKSYTLPKLAELSDGEFIQQYVNMGILKMPKLEITKNVYDSIDEAVRKNINTKVTPVGSSLYYEIILKNTVEHSVVKNIKLKDVIPEGTLFTNGTLSLTKSNGTVESLTDSSFSGRTLLIENIEDLQGTNGKVTIGFYVTVEKNASGIIKNIASVTGETVEGKVEKISNEVTNQVPPLPTLSKDVDLKEAKLGDILTYTLTVSNTQGGGAWQDVTLTDVLPKHLEYVKNSTIKQINNKPIEAVTDAASWKNEYRDLILNVGTIQSEDSLKVTFKAQIIDLPESNEIINKVNATGKDKDLKEYSPKEAEAKTILFGVKLNIRQVVLNNDEKELVIPKQAYYDITNIATLGGSDVKFRYSATSNSSTLDKTGEIEKKLFTSYFLEIDKVAKGLFIVPLVPEYYEYVGHVQSKDSSLIGTEHLSKNKVKDLPYLDYQTNAEYWVTVYITPKFAENEDSPRPYSWSFRTNQFGELKK